LKSLPFHSLISSCQTWGVKNHIDDQIEERGEKEKGMTEFRGLEDGEGQ
jgi:hypothetical protein